ncbi:MAG: DUF2813 domain-containing protein [Deltaproteobacteria bacterium]|nr:DUF2813 domain-containing protein [Deltaproteobacteria bacterium]
MHLKSASIENFRALKSINVTFASKGPTVFIGENNAGKTALLRAIGAALATLRSAKTVVFDSYDFHVQVVDDKLVPSGPIKITLHFQEASAGEWSDELRQQLAGITAFDPADTTMDPLHHVLVRVTATQGTSGIEVESDFLDFDGTPLGTREAKGPGFQVMYRLAPFFYLSAMRDAGTNFGTRGEFWKPFLDESTIPAAKRAEVEAALRAVNEKIVAAHDSFEKVRGRLKDVAKVVTSGTGVNIEAVPSRIFDILGRSQVTFDAPGGAAIPLQRHGEGTQSLSVLMLFDAFLRNKLGDPDASALLGLEEPEAHLHPNATRTLFLLLNDLPGQTLISTHSGDLLAAVDPRSIRRLHRRGGTVALAQLDGTLDAVEMERFHRAVRRNRGELMFARSWLLVEGEAEVAIFEILDELVAPFAHRGVRIIEYAQIGLEALIKAANQLGIPWHLVSDGDPTGTTEYVPTGTKHLNGRASADHITQLSAKDVLDFFGGKKTIGKPACLAQARKDAADKNKGLPKELLDAAQRAAALAGS